MSKLLDIEQAVNAFVGDHDFATDTYSPRLGVHLCPHLGPWVEGLVATGAEEDEIQAFAALIDQSTSSLAATALQGLNKAELPPGWAPMLTWAVKTAPAGDFVHISIGALYGLIEQRLYGSARTGAAAFVYLVEGTAAFEYAYIDATESINYVPLGSVETWWRDYMNVVDSSFTYRELREISDALGGVCETEILSSLTPSGRLSEIYGAGSFSSVAAANPNLPADLVNEQMEGDWQLLFHPNADRDRSWVIVQRILEDGDYEDLASNMIEFGDMKDHGWYDLSGFGTTSPQAQWLRARMGQWLLANIEDEDELEEALELLGIDTEAL